MTRLALVTRLVLGTAAMLGWPCGVGRAAEPPVPPQTHSAAPRFTEPPKVHTLVDGFAITFAVDSACDATVWVAAADGEIVRRLATGRLGANAPEPFQKNSLTQRINWDGKDGHGRPAPAGCVAHVGLGLKADFSRILFALQPGIATRGPAAISCDPRGTLYILWGHMRSANLGGLINLTAFDREGNYLRTVKPFRSDLPEEKVSVAEFFQTADGRRIPLTGPDRHRPYTGFLPGINNSTRHTPVITRDGRYVFPSSKPVANAGGKSTRRLLILPTDGSCPKELYYGPPLPPAADQTHAFLALSPDEKWIYISGTYHSEKRSKHHAVYRVQWTDTEPPAPFVGIECVKGDDDTHLNDPRGIAVDADGRLHVCDYMNDRVQIYSPEGKILKTLPLRGPEQILVHPRTRAIYVLSVRDRDATATYVDKKWPVYEDKSIIKYRSFEDLQEVARIDLPKRQRYFHDTPPILALDASGDAPVIWAASVGRQEPGDHLWKIVDEGDALKRVEHKVTGLERWASGACPAIAAARDHNEFYLAGEGLEGAVRVKAGTGRLEPFPLPKGATEWLGGIRVGPEGRLYVSRGEVVQPPKDMRWVIRRYERDGKLIPFRGAEGLPTLGYHAGTFFGEKQSEFSVGPDGRIYVSECSAPGGKERARLNVYSPDGELVKAGLISDMTHTAAPVAVDGMGRLYVADAIKPVDLPFPTFLGGDPRNHFRTWYGTVCRFGPEGGAFRHVGPLEKHTHVGGYPSGRGRIVIEGALWEYFGISPMPQSSTCECNVAGLEADAFGRVFVPDVLTYSVQVLDPAGNLILRFGQYGNWDAQGPTSAVRLPEIPLRYPRTVAALDEYVAVGDAHNRRVVEVRLSYRTRATAPVPQ